MLVIDASAVIDLLLARPAGREVARRMVEHDFDLHAPHLLDVEVLSALRRLVRLGAASADRAGDALEDLLDLHIERYPHWPLAPRIWELRENLSAYDATYFALAEAVDAALLTSDARSAAAGGEHAGAPVLLAAAT